MGTFAETANVDYRLLFAELGKQTSVLSIDIYIRKQNYVYIIYIHIHIHIHIPIYIMPLQTEDGKWKPRCFSLIRLLFAHRTNGSLSFVRLLTKKQTEVIRLQKD
jgi:hypothetical protein